MEKLEWTVGKKLGGGCKEDEDASFLDWMANFAKKISSFVGREYES